jgi:hypothetical protein
MLSYKLWANIRWVNESLGKVVKSIITPKSGLPNLSTYVIMKFSNCIHPLYNNKNRKIAYEFFITQVNKKTNPKKM